MFQVDSSGVVTRINGEGTQWTRPTSGRKVRANRRNARQHSTGPTTAQGKKRSSMNAVTHGVLASGLEPIDRGPFSEDRDDFYRRLDAVIDSLEPRDPLEERVARQIASQTIRYDRLDRLETAAHESAARMNPYQLSRLGAEGELDELAAWARGLHYYLTDAAGGSDVPYRDYAVLMRSMGPKPGVQIRDLWDAEHRPSSARDWKKAFSVLLRTLWSSKEEASVWALKLSIRLTNEWAAIEGRERELAAGRVLEGPFDAVTRYHGRITSDLVRLFDLYSRLRERRLRPLVQTNPPEEGAIV